MKRLGFALLVVLVLALVIVDVGAQSRAVVRTVTGKVEIQNPGTTAWRPATAGMEVPLRATISTGFGAGAVLELDASNITVRQLTRLRIDELRTQNNVAQTNLSMPVGRIRAEVKSTPGATTDFRLRSPVSTAAVRGTGFESDGERLWVFDAIVALVSLSGIEMNVNEGETGVSEGGGAPSGGADERDANTTVNPFTSPIAVPGLGGVMTGLGVGTITVKWTD